MSRILAAVLCLWLAPAASADITLNQHGGGSLQLDQPARSVVTLAPNLAELAWAAGGGEYLGQIKEILSTPGNDVYVVKHEERKDLLIPVLVDVVLSVDTDGNRMTVEVPPGL